jgi:hypothetical protein
LNLYIKKVVYSDPQARKECRLEPKAMLGGRRKSGTSIAIDHANDPHDPRNGSSEDPWTKIESVPASDRWSGGDPTTRIENSAALPEVNPPAKIDIVVVVNDEKSTGLATMTVITRVMTGENVGNAVVLPKSDALCLGEEGLLLHRNNDIDEETTKNLPIITGEEVDARLLLRHQIIEEEDGEGDDGSVLAGAEAASRRILRDPHPLRRTFRRVPGWSVTMTMVLRRTHQRLPNRHERANPLPKSSNEVVHLPVTMIP